jgi:hypothetical protein
MAAIFAGIALLLFVVIAYAMNIELGSSATIILLSLGSVLIAISFIDTIKVSATGFELKTREQKNVATINFNVPHLNYLEILCWMVLACLFALVMAIWSVPFSYSNVTSNLAVLLIWNWIFAVPAGITLVVRKWTRPTGRFVIMGVFILDLIAAAITIYFAVRYWV